MIGIWFNHGLDWNKFDKRDDLGTGLPDCPVWIDVDGVIDALMGTHGEGDGGLGPLRCRQSAGRFGNRIE